MKVHELIAELQKLPRNAEVYVSEDEYDCSIESVEMKNVAILHHHGLRKFENYSHICHDCGKDTYKDWDSYTVCVNEGYWEDEFWVCEECAKKYARCPDCGCLCSDDVMMVDESGRKICSDCYYILYGEDAEEAK